MAYYIITFICGCVFGFSLAAVCAASGKAQQEEYYKQKLEEYKREVRPHVIND